MIRLNHKSKFDRLMFPSRLSFQPILILILFIIYAYVPSFVFAASPEEKEIKNVLVVNSYHPGYEWSDDIVKGIQSVLGDNNFNIFIEYLDSKRYFDEIYFKQLEKILRYKYSTAKIDAIIVSDHHAFYLMLEMRKTFHADVPLVFCGIDRIDPEDLADYKPIYGVLEGDSGIQSTLDLILSIHPGIKKIFFIADQTMSAEVMLNYVRDYEPFYKENVAFDYLINMSTDELKAALKKVPPNSVVMWVHFVRDKNGKVLSLNESQTFVANNASVPVYVCYGFSADTGIVGGSIIRGFDQGEKAAQVAMQLLNRESIVPISFFQQSTFKNVFDYKVMKRFNIGIKDIPENSVIYNKPFSVYEKYRWQIIGIIIFMSAQMLLIALMLINQRKRKQVEEALRDSEEKFRHLMEQSPFSIQIIKPDGRVDQFNKAFMELWGISEETLPEIIEKYNVFEDEEARKLGLVPLIEKACRGETVILPEIEYDASRTMEKLKIVGTDSKKVWIQVRLYPIKNSNGEVVNVVFIEEDITERKQAEKEILRYQQHLKALASQLTVTEEKERRRIATDLHDQIGQSLALARMQIAATLKSATDAGQAAKLDDISELLREAVHDTRHLMFDLSPPAMHQIGLGAAISEWLEDQIEKRYGIKTEFFDNIDEGHRKVLDENVRAILFRNVRELLVNVVKHAQANQVTVLMEVTDGVLKIVVQDYGIGFDHLLVSQTGGTGGGFGLFSIKERMTNLCGALEIESQPGRGCKAVISVPLDIELASSS